MENLYHKNYACFVSHHSVLEGSLMYFSRLNGSYSSWVNALNPFVLLFFMRERRGNQTGSICHKLCSCLNLNLKRWIRLSCWMTLWLYFDSAAVCLSNVVICFKKIRWSLLIIPLPSDIWATFPPPWFASSMDVTWSF